jgi:hypothetical protein
MTCFKYRILYGCILFWNSIVEVLLCFLTKKLQPFIRTTFFIIGTYFPSFWCWIIVRECSCDRVFDVSSYCFTQIYPFVLFFWQTLKAMSQHGFDVSTMNRAMEEDHQVEWIDSEDESMMMNMIKIKYLYVLPPFYLFWSHLVFVL